MDVEGIYHLGPSTRRANEESRVSQGHDCLEGKSRNLFSHADNSIQFSVEEKIKTQSKKLPGEPYMLHSVWKVKLQSHQKKEQIGNTANSEGGFASGITFTDTDPSRQMSEDFHYWNDDEWLVHHSRMCVHG